MDAFEPTDTDSALSDRAVGGDREAFAALVGCHYDRVYRVGVRALGNEDEAADLTQDVFAGLAARLPFWRGDSLFTTWLYRVTVNAARDRMRRSEARRRNERAFAETDALKRAVQAERESDGIWLRHTLDTLGVDLRMTVSLVVEEGLSHAEAAWVLDVAESTVSWRMHEVRRRLRALTADSEVMT